MLAQISQKLNSIERAEMVGKLTLDVGYTIRTDFDGLSKQDLLREHIIIVQKNRIQSTDNFAQFARGKLYLSLTDVVEKSGQRLKDFVNKELNISYMTFLRYMTLASIISSYPSILLCELSFAQILKHKKRLFFLVFELDIHD